MAVNDNEVVKRLTDIERRLRKLESYGDRVARPRYGNFNFSSPPTDAEMDAQFGTPATVGAGFTAIIDDTTPTPAVWFVVSDGTSWWAEQLTQLT